MGWVVLKGFSIGEWIIYLLIQYQEGTSISQVLTMKSCPLIGYKSYIYCFYWSVCTEHEWDSCASNNYKSTYMCDEG